MLCLRVVLNADGVERPHYPNDGVQNEMRNAPTPHSVGVRCL